MEIEDQNDGENNALHKMEEELPSDRKFGCLQHIKNAVLNITVEPIAFLYVAPRLLCGLALENLYLEKACLVNLSLNETICHAMVVRNRSGYGVEDEIAVQEVVSRMLPYKSIFHIFQIICILIIGGWCDRSGKRRPMFVVPYIGDMTAVLGYILCVYFFMDLGAEYPVIMESVFSIGLGGIPLVMAGMYSYVATISDTKSRTVRVGAVSIVLRASLTLGIGASGFAYKYFGFYGVFFIALGFNVIGFIYIFTIVKNVSPNNSNCGNGKEKQCCQLLWNGVRGSLVECFQICFKSGPNRRRTRMILLQLTNILSFGVMLAEGSVLYLYSRRQFGWDEVDFSIFKFYRTIVEISGCIFVLVFLSKYMRWNDGQIALLAVASRIIGITIMATGQSGLFLYIGTLADVFNGAIIIAVRSLITKTVNKNELALANSLTGLFDSLGFLLIGTLYAYVYYSTLAIFPGTFFVVSLITYIPILIMLLIIKNIVYGNNIHKEEE
ncbi:proton-coupled folate transporter-like [Harmonia axyridis]|uniref:proton-coupled folate transporter-like n=1 Tax=Harmonia axyridis TaxID=115357 RepID=UPI001E27971D|nr:proton-coupled folate transporter-like [Harmonia axyridis]